MSDEAGHGGLGFDDGVEPFDPDVPFGSNQFLHAVDLFNAGYDWEANEL